MRHDHPVPGSTAVLLGTAVPSGRLRIRSSSFLSAVSFILGVSDFSTSLKRFRVNLGFRLGLNKLYQGELRLFQGLYKLYTDQFYLKIFNAKSPFLLSFSLFQVFAFSYFVYVCLIRRLLNCLIYVLISCLVLVFIHVKIYPFYQFHVSSSSC